MNQVIVFQGMGKIFLEASQALLPLTLFFFLFNYCHLKLPREFIFKVVVGLVLAVLGLTLFLHGVHIGFLPTGMEMGRILGGADNNWILVPIGFLLGIVATMAEPAVRVLGYEVEKASGGRIRQQLLLGAVSLGVAGAVGLGLLRTIYGIPFYHLIIPGYLLVLIMLKFSNPEFTAIAFDSGGVATGPMTVTFIMAVAMGAAEIMEGRNVLVDGFGLIALVALAPILTVMGLGLIFAEKEEQEEMLTHDLVVTIVKKGWSEKLLKAAKKAGAEGGTVVCGRGMWKGKEKALLGIPIEPEKEMILIVTHSDKTQPIMEAIIEAGNLEKPGTGIVFSLELSRVAGLGHSLTEANGGEGE